MLTLRKMLLMMMVTLLIKFLGDPIHIRMCLCIQLI